MTTFPDAPEPTTAFTSESEMTSNEDASTPPNVTEEVPDKCSPEIRTDFRSEGAVGDTF
jgi:hypothetical protein